MSSVNDLCQRIGIRHPLEQSTCIGYGQRKPTCGCAVAESSRLSALARLEGVNDNFNTGARISNEVLHSIAGLLLCKRWHQAQADENVQTWRRNLRQNPTTPARAQAITALSNATPAQWIPAPRVESVPRPSLELFSNDQLLREIKRRLQHAQNDELLHAVVEVATAAIQRHDNTRDQRRGNASVGNSRSNVDEIPRNNHPRMPSPGPAPYTVTAGHSSQANHSQPLQNRPATVNTTAPAPATATQTTLSTAVPTIENVRQARIAALTPATTSMRPQPPARAPSPVRQSHLECVVCAMSYEEDPAEHWECRSCLNRVHMHCFEAWRASQLPGRVTCIHCRGRVPQEAAR